MESKYTYVNSKREERKEGNESMEETERKLEKLPLSAAWARSEVESQERRRSGKRKRRQREGKSGRCSTRHPKSRSRRQQHRQEPLSRRLELPSLQQRAQPTTASLHHETYRDAGDNRRDSLETHAQGTSRQAWRWCGRMNERSGWTPWSDPSSPI